MNPFFEETFFIIDIKNVRRVRDEIATSIHRNRPYHGLVLFTKGESKFIFQDDTSFVVKQNQVVYLPKYSNYDSCDALGTECIAINFDIQAYNCTFPNFSLHQMFGEKYRQKFHKILRLWNEQSYGYVNGSLAVLYEIIFQIQQDARRQYVSSRQSQIVEEATLFINTHLIEHTLSVEELAQTLNITPEYLRRIFKAVKGISPMEYILEKRTELAKNLIATGDIKLRFIAEECGFNDYPYFSRVFKNRTGLSPLQYSKSLLCDNISSP